MDSSDVRECVRFTTNLAWTLDPLDRYTQLASHVLQSEYAELVADVILLIHSTLLSNSANERKPRQALGFIR